MPPADLALPPMSMSADVSTSEKAASSKADGEKPKADVAEQDPAAILRKMQEAQAREGAPLLKERLRRLERLEKAIIVHQDAIASAMRDDFGNKARAEALTS